MGKILAVTYELVDDIPIMSRRKLPKDQLKQQWPKMRAERGKQIWKAFKDRKCEEDLLGSKLP